MQSIFREFFILQTRLTEGLKIHFIENHFFVKMLLLIFTGL
jgi:hypothetical protein